MIVTSLSNIKINSSQNKLKKYMYQLILLIINKK